MGAPRPVVLLSFGGVGMPGLEPAVFGRLDEYLFLLTGPVAAGAAAQAKPNPNWPKTLTLGTASVGGTFFVYGQVWASLVNEKLAA